MRGGAGTAILEAWQREAHREPKETDQQILADLTLTFAALAGNREAWGRALEGFAVIKSRVLPGFFVVTVPALLPKLTFVLIVFAVACGASRGRIAKLGFLAMAGIAFDQCVCIFQGEIGVRVFE